MMYNSFNPYTQRLQQMEQTFGQPIQTIQPQQPQAICYFVNSKTDMQNVQVQPNVVYIGINRKDKEIYVRSWNNDGVIDFDTYSLAQGEKENTELKTIMEKLDILLKEKDNAAKLDTNSIAGQVPEHPANTIV